MEGPLGKARGITAGSRVCFSPNLSSPRQLEERDHTAPSTREGAERSRGLLEVPLSLPMSRVGWRREMAGRGSLPLTALDFLTFGAGVAAGAGGKCGNGGEELPSHTWPCF